VSLPRLPTELVALIPHWDTKDKTLDLTMYTSAEANSITVQSTCYEDYFKFDVNTKIIECLVSNEVEKWQDLILVTAVKGDQKEYSYITVTGGVESKDTVQASRSRLHLPY
jgi:hypothetical protein